MKRLMRCSGSRSRKVEPPDIVRREGAERVFEIARAEQREAELAADAVGAGIRRRRVGIDEAMLGDGPQAVEQGARRRAAEAATVKPREQLPAHLVDQLAGFLTSPIADRAGDDAIDGDAQHLDLAGLVIGQIAPMAIEGLLLAF